MRDRGFYLYKGKGALVPAFLKVVRGDFTTLTYRADLKFKARQLRENMTDSETLLWKRLRRKQLLGVQFYRQKPVGPYIVDFYAPTVELVIEVDGSQHLQEQHAERDKERDNYLRTLGLVVVRFTSREVLEETEAVLEAIYRTMVRRLK